MPLTDLVRLLNSPEGVFPHHYSRKGLDQPFVAAQGRVFLHYAGIRVESRFIPVLETRSGKLHGHAATILAFGLATNKPLSGEALFVLPTDDEEFIYLDRLVRTLHALNYLTRPTRGNLLLPVHARHVLSVPTDHGLAFEEILRPCGLFPEQVTLEIDIAGIEETERLVRAVANYRSRGYGIAISRFGRKSLDFHLLHELRPDIVKLDPLLVASTRPLKRIVASLVDLPSRVLIDGVDSTATRCAAAADGIDLLQAHESGRRLLHAVRTFPSNALDSIRNVA